MDRDAQALETLEQAIAADTQSSEGLRIKSHRMLHQDQSEAAYQAARDALEIAPRRAANHAAVAMVFWRLADKAQAHKALATAKEIDEEDLQVLRAEGTIALESEQLGRAEARLHLPDLAGAEESCPSLQAGAGVPEQALLGAGSPGLLPLPDPGPAGALGQPG